MATAAKDVIRELYNMVDENPGTLVSFQLPDGTSHVVDPQITPYLHRGVIVVPIMEASEAETYGEDDGPQGASQP